MSAYDTMSSLQLACICALLLAIASVHAEVTDAPLFSRPAGDAPSKDAANQPGPFSGLQGQFILPAGNQNRPGMGQFGPLSMPGNGQFSQDQFPGQNGGRSEGLNTQMRQLRQLVTQALQSLSMQQQLLQSLLQQQSNGNSNPFDNNPFGSFMRPMSYLPGQMSQMFNGAQGQRGFLIPSQRGLLQQSQGQVQQLQQEEDE